MAVKEQGGRFPSELVSDAEKDSKDYGFRVGQMIEDEWFKSNSGGGIRYYDFQEEFHRLRRYARGEQSIRKYKDEFKTNGDLSYINLDWKPVPIIPKFVDIVVNGMHNRLFDVNVKAIDSISSKERGAAAARLERDMIVKQYASQMAAATGATGLNMPIDKIPDNAEELELHMQMNYKQGIEVAEEQAIEYVMKDNNYHSLRKKLLKDMTTIGISAAKHEYNTADGINLKYCDPAKMVWSYTEQEDFSDVYYWGEIKALTLSQLRKEFPWLTDAEVKDIKDQANNGENYPNVYFGQTGHEAQDDDNIVQVLYYTFKTYRNYVHKVKTKNNGVQVASKKDDNLAEPKDGRSGYEKIQTVREVLYEGVKVMKGDIVIKWELQTNMIRPKANTSKVVSPFIMYSPSMYKGRIESLVQRMTPYADHIQTTHLKLQQARQKMTPDGVAIDVDALAEIDLGNGTNYDPREALNMYFQTGSIVVRTMDKDGDPNRSIQPVTPISGNNAGDKIQILIGLYDKYLDMLRDVTGLNEAADGSTPSEYALPGTQKLAAANSNTATRHILDSVNDVTKRLAEGISVRISDVLQYSNTKQEFIQSIGQFDVANLSDVSKLYLHNFGIFIAVHPDEEEKQKIDNNISIALQSGQIDIDDVIDIQGQTNVKLASQYLKLKKKKKAKRDAEARQQEIQAQAQANAQAAQTAAEAEALKETVIADNKIKVEEAKAGFEMEKLQAEVLAKKELMREEFQYKIQIAGMTAQGANEKFQQGEANKDKRQADGATQASQLIEQRNTRAPAKDFGALAGAIRDKSTVEGATSPSTFESAGNDTLSEIGNLGQYDPQ